MSTETLFDLEPYGGAETPREQAARTRAASREASRSIVEPHLDPWVLIRDRAGVKPYFHLVRSRVSTGAVSTMCGIMGNQITNVGVAQMVRCPGCDVGAQVEQLALL